MNVLEKIKTTILMLLLQINEVFVKAKIARNERGMASGIIVLVISLLTLVVALIVGLIVTGSLAVISASTNYGSATANATAAQLFTNVYAAFNLATITPIIAAAGIIIAIIGVYFSFGRTR
jgi:hypothetical protein